MWKHPDFLIYSELLKSLDIILQLEILDACDFYSS